MLRLVQSRIVSRGISFCHAKRSIATPLSSEPVTAHSNPKRALAENMERLSKGQPIAFQSQDMFEPEDRQVQIFTHTDTPLGRVRMFGFDYDYTIATYNQRVPDLIFHEGLFLFFFLSLALSC